MSDVALYRGTSPIRKHTTLGPYRKPLPMVLGGSQGGWAFSYGRGTLVRLIPDSRLAPRGRTSNPISLIYKGISLIRNAHPPRANVGPCT